jgi:tetratricopeptide (TPR) repeat protein
VVARADGIPFFLEELAKQSMEDAGTPGHLTLPATVQAVLAARIDRLPADHKRILETAAVVGEEVPLALLQAITDDSKGSLIRCLTHLQAAELLCETQLVPEVVYRFKHGLTHQVAYDRQDGERRRRLHVRIVEVLEASDAERRFHHVVRLAHHALAGELWSKAIAYLTETGGQATARYANREAVAFFEQALAALDRVPRTRETVQQAIDLRFGLRYSLVLIGRVPEMREHLQEAERLASTIGDTRRLGWAWVYMSHFLLVSGSASDAYALSQKARAVAETHDDLALKVVTHLYDGAATLVSGDCAQARTPLRKAIELVEGAEGGVRHRWLGIQEFPALICSGYLVWALAEHGDFAEGGLHQDRWVSIAEQVVDPLRLGFLCWNLGYLWTLKGDFDRAVSVLERGKTLCRERDLRIVAPLVSGLLGYALVLRGRVDEGLRLLAEATEATESLAIAGYHSLFLVRLGEATLVTGRLEEARELAERGLRLARGHGQRGYEAWALLLLGRIEAQAGTPGAADAERFYREARALAHGLGMRPLVAHCHAALAELCAHHGRRRQSEKHFTAATSMYREMGMLHWLERAEAERREDCS